MHSTVAAAVHCAAKLLPPWDVQNICKNVDCFVGVELHMNTIGPAGGRPRCIGRLQVHRILIVGARSRFLFPEHHTVLRHRHPIGMTSKPLIRRERLARAATRAAQIGNWIPKTEAIRRIVIRVDNTGRAGRGGSILPRPAAGCRVGKLLFDDVALPVGV